MPEITGYGTVQLCAECGLTRGELWGLRQRYPEAFPQPFRVGPGLIWPSLTRQIVLDLIAKERKSSEVAK
jgi:hypothetical protein